MKIPFGPTYEEMLHPETIAPELRQKALRCLAENELEPVNLFNITWKDKNNETRKVILPPELTGVDCNIVVLLGCGFPSGSHKVGPAYATLIEGCVDGSIIPGEHTILGPSTGNFGIGVSYICNLMGLQAIVIMPDNMSRERYERISRYGAKLDLTPGTESDVILTLERTHELMKNPKNRALAQFELMPNYRFHRHVTGHSCADAVKGIGNGRVSAFVSAPGSAGTLAAGDALKKLFPECKIVALEPEECSTLADGGRGQHRIEGIGDKMCTLIHNVGNTDFVTLIHDDSCVKGLDVIEADYPALHGLFGVSGICNILGAIKTAKFLRLGPDDNVVTIATDGLDRYHSVREELGARVLERTPRRWKRKIFDECTIDGVLDFRSKERKERLFAQKEKDWLPFGYTKEYMDSMRCQSFWDNEYTKIGDIDRKIKELRQNDEK